MQKGGGSQHRFSLPDAAGGEGCGITEFRGRGKRYGIFRQTESRLNPRLCYFCIKGVAGIIIDTEVYIPQLSDFYLTQKRDEHGFYTK